MSWLISRRKGPAPFPEVEEAEELEIQIVGGNNEETLETEPFVAASSDYGISVAAVNSILQGRDVELVKEHGGSEGLANALLSSSAKGMDAQGIQQSKRVFGTNVHRQRPPTPFLKIVVDTLKDPVILLLMAAATVSTILGLAIEEEREHNGWIEGVAIWMAVLVVTIVGAGNDYQKDQQFRKLNEQREVVMVKVLRQSSPPETEAGKVASARRELRPMVTRSSTSKRRRDHNHMVVLNSEVVVGDIVILDTGDKIVADGIVLSSNELAVDEASLNGETAAVHKSKAGEGDPWLWSGTQVIEGSGAMLVMAVGDNSQWGKTLSLMVDAGNEQTPLQKKLEDVAATVGKIGGAVAVACFVAMMIAWIIEHHGFPLNKVNEDGPVQFFMFCVTIVVVAVPEGLPLAVTISLAYSMMKMMRDNSFVRVLAACETMGGATAICSDKTGTLTENRMTVVEGWFGGKHLNHAPAVHELSPTLLSELTHNIALSSKAFLLEYEDGRIDFVGNRTECALLALMRSWDIDYQELRDDCEQMVAKLHGFSSATKMSSVLLHKEGAGQGLRVQCKGAAEWVLARCTSQYLPDGTVAQLTDETRAELQEALVSMASRGLRCVCLAARDVSAEDVRRRPARVTDAEKTNQDLTVLAVVGIKDPLRVEVPAAVAACQRAGIVVRMVTGDNILTASHIARECGILTRSGVAMEGPKFRAMTDLEAQGFLPSLQVLARSTPEDKLRLVRLLKAQGDVVAVTGDGTNDAPALKESDVGLAMGIAGTEVAKEAADIIILDDNFSSIVKSVSWGRSVFSNIRKFLQFQLTVNLVALVTAFLGAVVGGKQPLTVLQLLWVNLIMDSLGSLALATEDPSPELLTQPPYGRNEHLITPRMWKHILVQSTYQLAWMMYLMYCLPYSSPEYHVTSPEEFYAEACMDTLMAIKGGKGHDAESAGRLCNYMQSCGMPYGASVADTAVCQLYSSYWESHGGNVPHWDSLKAICHSDDSSVTHCPEHVEYQRAAAVMHSAYSKEEEEDSRRGLSVLFNAFIMMQISNEVCSRRINDELSMFEGVFNNNIFIAVIVLTLSCQVAIMQTAVGSFFKVDPLTSREWLYTCAIGAGVFPVSFITRLLSGQRPRMNLTMRDTKSEAARRL